MMLEAIYRVQFAADVAMATLIWMVQLVIYPAFRVVRPEGFVEWHHQYMKTVSCIVIPIMLLQALTHGALLVYHPTITQWLSSLAVIGAWVVTFTLSVPCHNQLQKVGHALEPINHLVQTNWIRTILWSAALIIGLW